MGAPKAYRCVETAMLDKNDILDQILRECDIALHLYKQLPEGSMDYRPTPGQRSTLELLTYLTHCAIGGTRAAAEGNWDGYQEVAKRAEGMTAEEFPAAMERQKEELRAYFDGLTQEQFDSQEAQNPMGDKMNLDRAIVDMPLHWMVAYRMQLFLYAKQTGNEDIWTPDCWAGVSMERPEPQAATDA